MPRSRIFSLIRSAGNRPLPFSNVSSSASAISTYLTPNNSGTTRHPHHFVGGKWIGIFDFFRIHPQVLDTYEYFWFPDDDIETSPENAERFLEIVQREKFQLAQPALTPDSYYAHHITLANPAFQFRRTNFVELMLPIMHRDLLLQVLPIFAGRHFAQGVDYMWHQLTKNPNQDVAIVDLTPMGHRRPRQVHLKGNMSKLHIDMLEERTRTFAELKIHRQAPMVHSAKFLDGSEVSSKLRLAWELAKGMLWTNVSISQQPWRPADHLRMSLHQLLSNSNKPTFDPSALKRLQEKKRLRYIS